MTSEPCTAILSQRCNSCGNRTCWYEYILFYRPVSLTSVVQSKTSRIIIYIRSATSFQPAGKCSVDNFQLEMPYKFSIYDVTLCPMLGVDV
jgi:hypothetical protein